MSCDLYRAEEEERETERMGDMDMERVIMMVGAYISSQDTLAVRCPDFKSGIIHKIKFLEQQNVSCSLKVLYHDVLIILYHIWTLQVLMEMG